MSQPLVPARPEGTKRRINEQLKNKTSEKYAASSYVKIKKKVPCPAGGDRCLGPLTNVSEDG